MGRSRWKGKRKMAFIKNIDHETVLNLADQIHAEPGQIVSKTLAQNKAVSRHYSRSPKARRSAPTIPSAMPWYM